MSLFSVGIMFAGCSSGKNGAVAIQEQTLISPSRIESLSQADRGAIIRSEERIGHGAVRVMPKGVAYRMSGEYADRVPISLTPSGELQTYPAPTDLTEASVPLPLADGWWLDRRGISLGSVFTHYTYDEYKAFDTAPSPEQLLAAVIPGARVTSVVRLPMTMQEAVADTVAVNAFIRSHMSADKEK